MNSQDILAMLLATTVVLGFAGCLETTDEQTPTETESPPLRLELNLQINESVAIEIKSTDGNATVFVEEYPPEAGQIDLNEELKSGRSYRVTISTPNETLWVKTINWAEGYELLIHENGSVSVEGYEEV